MQPQRNMMVQLLALDKLMATDYPNIKAKYEIMTRGVTSFHNALRTCLYDFKRFGQPIPIYPQMQEAVRFAENIGIRNASDANYAANVMSQRCHAELEENGWHATKAYVLQKEGVFIPSYYAGHTAQAYDRAFWEKNLENACVYYSHRDIDRAIECAGLDGLVAIEAVEMRPIDTSEVTVMLDVWGHADYAMIYMED